MGTTKKPWNNKAAGILPYCKKTNRFLLFLRSPQIQDYSNTWATVGGKVDPSDTNKYKTAALREMCEEAEFCESIELRLLYIFRKSKFTYRTYIGFVPVEFTPKLNWENSDAKWVSKDEMVNHENLHPGFAEMLANDDALTLLEKHT